MKIKTIPIPFILKFVFVFYIAYFLIAMLGGLIIDYKPLKLIVMFIYAVYILSILIGIYLGHNINLKIINKINVSATSILNVITIISTVTVLICWWYMLEYYGSIEYIIAHSFDIRTETIGNGISLVPTSITYLSSLQYYGIALAFVLFNIYKSKKYILHIVVLFILIVLSDLRSFGRVGILYAIFVILAFMFLYRKKIFSLKKIASFFGLYFLLMLPRLIRGGFDNFSSSISNYSSYFLVEIPSVFYGFVTVYIYYFSPLYAFNQLVDNNNLCYYGMRNFAPIVNVLNRIFNFMDQRVVLIAPSSNIPFDYNIYHIIGELYMDFGIVGVCIFPIFFGLFIGYIFRFSGVYADSLKIMMFAWILFTPIYNVFSFGAFFIAFVFSFICFIFFTTKLSHES